MSRRTLPLAAALAPALSGATAALARWPIRDGPLLPQLLVSGLVFTAGIVTAGAVTACAPPSLPPPSPFDEAPGGPSVHPLSPSPSPLPPLPTRPPRRRLGGQALVLSISGAVLLVESVDRDGFRLPGGPADENEPPYLAAARHVERETGLVLPLRTLVGLDWTPAAQQTYDALDLVFWGGRLTGTQEAMVARHRPPKGVAALHWVHGMRLDAVVHPDHLGRVRQALETFRRGRVVPVLLRGAPVGVEPEAVAANTP